jgi:hypothetical protein
VTGLERSNIVLYPAAQAYDFDRLRAQDVLLMIAQGDIEKYAGQKDNHEDAHGCA